MDRDSLENAQLFGPEIPGTGADCGSSFLLPPTTSATNFGNSVKRESVSQGISCGELQSICETEKLMFERVIIKTEESDELEKLSATKNFPIEYFDGKEKKKVLDVGDVVKSEPANIAFSEPQSICETEKLMFERVIVKTEESDEVGKLPAAESFPFKCFDGNGEKKIQGQHTTSDDLANIEEERGLSHGSVWTADHQRSLANQSLSCIVIAVKEENEDDLFNNAVEDISHENHEKTLPVEHSTDKDSDLVPAHDNTCKSSAFNPKTCQENKVDVNKCEAGVDANGTSLPTAELQECELFGNQLLTVSQLNCHVKMHSYSKPYECKGSSEAFTEQKSSKEPKRIHSGGINSYKSETSLKACASKQNLNVHKRTHSGAKPYKCDRCLKVFARKAYLDQHKSVHANIKPYECVICSKSFASKAYANLHQQSHSGFKPFHCESCSEAFTSKYFLLRHEQTHSGVKAYKCELCLKEFYSKGSLCKHKRTHFGSKPYKCEICSKAFALKGNVDKHKLIHSSIKPYKCGICSKTFVQKANKNVHEQIHLGLKPYPCEFCSRAFRAKHLLTQHEQMHSGAKPHECEMCPKAFTRKANLIAHEQIHLGFKPHQCEVCLRGFTRKANLIAHEQTHSGFKPYQCEICSKAFMSKYNVLRHEQTHSSVTKPYIS